jgi:hypothetical protein
MARLYTMVDWGLFAVMASVLFFLDKLDGE